MQRSFFELGIANGLEGFRYESDLLDHADEQALLTHLRTLPFREFEFHGFTGKRRVVSFGWKYQYSGEKLVKTDEIPEFLLAFRVRAASFAGLEPQAFEHVLITEYGPGAGIGWHRDKAVFGEVVGISLLAPCTLRFRRKAGEKWERVNVLAEPRSAYHLTGPARSEWQHSILRVDALRYSITFRTMREAQ
ncbi:MAG TPA: alpha-ketoglutarate-dependent dioxygenase AlkB [Pyrinomonadaceae bacterium]|nr:alpha-ketoglutarate-dependent dioxygenase AlkB [Pyrinomonadaceae bacterium]